MEADLSQYHQIDYRDRWRFDEHGRRRLTLRMIWVRIRTLPRDSATQIALNDGRIPWGWSEHLLADLWSAFTGKPHPNRPKTQQRKRQDERVENERRKRLARKRARDRAPSAQHPATD